MDACGRPRGPEISRDHSSPVRPERLTGADGGDIFAGPSPRIFSIDAGRPFLIDLADGIRRAAGTGPFALADTQIFVPTRRAARALIEAFAASAAGASLLPRIRPLGDIDEDELTLGATAGLAEEIDLPPAISSLERLLVLSRLVAAAGPAFAGQTRWPAAVAAAKELARLLDSFHAEEISFGALKSLAPAEHAAHWKRSLDFLKIVTEAWPEYLGKRGLMDPAERRARLIHLQAERLRRTPPETPVIVAGTTGSAPAVARLIETVAALPLGAAVLPGFDRALAVEDPKAWDAIDDPHPQAGLKALLGEIKVEPEAVLPWPHSGAASPRARLLSLALRPAEATDDWRERVAELSARDPVLDQSCAGLTLVEARDEESEATAAALMMRQALEIPGQRAMLVTPDRNLARRVAARLGRWQITVDDSAGIPFANTPCGTFLRLVSNWLTGPSDPVAILSLVRHPLAGFGLSEGRGHRARSALDRCLRGVAPEPGIEGLAKKVARGAHNAEGAAPLLEALQRALDLWPGEGSAPLGALLAAHLAVAEALAADAKEKGADRLWRGDDGEAGAMLLASLQDAAEDLGDIDAADYPQTFSAMIAGASVRPRDDAHPRLSILGPLEARLQSADLVILGGLNEGVWPADAASDPFLSRLMRREIGLPSPERRHGLAAHDFAQLAAAPAVALTRARVAGGAPTKPSRWIVRLKNILEGAKAFESADETARFAQWARALDRPAIVTPVKRPAPRPPVGARPRALFVTRFEDLLRDPYAVYARYILKLRYLDPVGEPAGRAQLGSLLHSVFEKFVREDADPAAPGARARLGAILGETAPEYGFSASAFALWRARLVASLDWFIEFDRERRRLGAPLVIEGTGEAAFETETAPFTLLARADRIDLLASGSAALFDYKSGSLPTLDQIKAKFSPQLPLTALIAEAGGFGDLGAVSIESFHYVKALNRNGKTDESGAGGADARRYINEARAGFLKLVAHFDDPETPYLSQPRPQFVNEYAKYDRLARRREWTYAEDDDER